ncbi:MAG TPA: TIGR03936 family radical SAM-associated protein [Flexilinea sp.]|nr:TIGR03936 family radical SAM-associated protein [Flexilinea sp.]
MVLSDTQFFRRKGINRMIRCRISYQKTGPLRYISHLDLQKVWIRVLLRAKIPLIYTQGFHPAPKIATAWPLPLGWEGKNELIDLWFDWEDDFDTEDQKKRFIETLNSQSPLGLSINSAEEVPAYSPALTKLIESADYRIKTAGRFLAEDLNNKIHHLLSQTSVERIRREKRYNLRDLIESASVSEETDEGPVIHVRMIAKDSAMGRPDEFADALGLDSEYLSFCRDRFYLSIPEH